MNRTLALSAVGLVALSAVAAVTVWSKSDTVGRVFEPKLAAAAAHHSSDELSNMFTRVKGVELNDTHMTSLDRLVVLPSGELLVVDLEAGQVHQYTATGDHMHRLGSRGRSPGQYLFPTGAIATDGNVGILDFTIKRFSVFAPDGRFMRSFSYSAQHMSGLNVAAMSNSDTVIIVAASHIPNTVPGNVRLVHGFESTGKHRFSTLSFQDVTTMDWIHRTEYLDALVQSAEDRVSIVVPYVCAIFDVDGDGSHRRRDLTCEGFRSPGGPLEIPPDDHRNGTQAWLRYQDWRVSWTPIEAFLADEQLTCVQYQTFSPLRYTLDVYSAAGPPRLIGRLRTNRLLLGRNPDGTFLFRESLTNRMGEQQSIQLGRYAIREGIL